MDFFIPRPELRLIEEFFDRGGRFASISGPAGIGKTTIALYVGREGKTRKLFPGGSTIINVGFPFSAFEFIDAHGKHRITDRSLIVFDDFDSTSPRLEHWITNALNDNEGLSVIATSRRRAGFQYSAEDLHVELEGFSEKQFHTFITEQLHGLKVDANSITRLFQLAGGSPLFADVAVRALRENIVTPDGLLKSFQEFDHSGILGPDGRQIRSDELQEKIKIDVASANDLIYREICKDPERMRLLTPSQFEELVAEMLSKQGYEIEMTPSSSDGGFDMYAARKDGLGSFLFLVECKRYTPPNKVGVELVRSLHGVVQQSQANAGIMVTSSFFTKGSQEFQRRVPYKLHLQDYVVMQMWLKRFGTGNDY